MTANKYMPALRFPEFEGEWKENSIGEVASKVGSGSTPKGGEKVYTDQGIVFIRSQNVINDRLNLSDVTYIPESVHKKMIGSEVKPSDVLLNITGASIGRSCVVPPTFTTGNVNQHVSIIRLIDGYSPYFLQAYLSSSKGQKAIDSSQAGGAREGLNFQNIRSLKWFTPPLPEQQKIAAFLTAVDDKLQQLTRKKALLEQYKKGVMQQIFSREIRFKIPNDRGEFVEPPEWEEKTLGSFARITTGSSNREDSTLDGPYTFFDRSQDIRTSDRFLFDTEAIIVPGEGKEFIPKHFIGKFDLHQRTYAIMEFSPNIGRYLFYFISFNTNHLLSHAVGSTVKSLRLPMFQSMPIQLPCLEEQHKIASFLSAIDEKINQVTTQLQHAQQWKKGLLQEMFV